MSGIIIYSTLPFYYLSLPSYHRILLVSNLLHMARHPLHCLPSSRLKDARDLLCSLHVDNIFIVSFYCVLSHLRIVSNTATLA